MLKVLKCGRTHAQTLRRHRRGSGQCDATCHAATATAATITNAAALAAAAAAWRCASERDVCEQCVSGDRRERGDVDDWLMRMMSAMMSDRKAIDECVAGTVAL